MKRKQVPKKAYSDKQSHKLEPKISSPYTLHEGTLGGQRESYRTGSFGAGSREEMLHVDMQDFEEDSNSGS